jgi:hypothetical protein
VLAGAVLALAVVGTPGAASASVTKDASATASGVRDCDHWAYYPNVKIDSARNMSCRSARRHMRRYKGPIRRTFFTPGGFYCYRVSGSRIAGQWRCRKGGRAFRFDFAD